MADKRKRHRPAGTHQHAAMTKAEMIELVQGVRATFLYGYFIEQFVWTKFPNFADECKGNFGFQGRNGKETSLSLDVLAEQLRSHEKGLRGNYYLFLNFEAIRFFYEIAHSYCQKTGQSDAYARTPWSQFARVIRNVVSHGNSAILTQWPSNLKQKGIVSVTWNGLTVRESEIGSHVSLDVVSLLELQEEIYAFLQGVN